MFVTCWAIESLLFVTCWAIESLMFVKCWVIQRVMFVKCWVTLISKFHKYISIYLFIYVHIVNPIEHTVAPGGCLT